MCCFQKEGGGLPVEEDLTGQTFDRLTVLYPTGQRNKMVRFSGSVNVNAAIL